MSITVQACRDLVAEAFDQQAAFDLWRELAAAAATAGVVVEAQRVEGPVIDGRRRLPVPRSDTEGSLPGGSPEPKAGKGSVSLCRFIVERKGG